MANKIRSYSRLFAYWMQANERSLNEERHGKIGIFGDPWLVQGLRQPLVAARVFFALRFLNLGSVRIGYFHPNQWYPFLCSLVGLDMFHSRVFRLGVLRILNKFNTSSAGLPHVMCLHFDISWIRESVDWKFLSVSFLASSFFAASNISQTATVTFFGLGIIEIFNRFQFWHSFASPTVCFAFRHILDLAVRELGISASIIIPSSFIAWRAYGCVTSCFRCRHRWAYFC